MHLHLPYSIHRLALTVLFLVLTLNVWTQVAARYTDSQPLIIVSEADFPPYSFYNEAGEPEGLNIDILDAILDYMQIPHRFALKSWDESARMFESKEADLIIDGFSHYHNLPYYDSRNILNYYKIKLVSRKDMPPILSIDELKQTDGIVIRDHCQVAVKMIKNLSSEQAYTIRSPKEALNGIVNGQYKYFLWGEEPLKWTIKAMGLSDSLQIGSLNIAIGETHFASYDKELIEQIDDQYARLQQSGDLDLIYDKWFHPERKHHDASLVAIYITVGIFLVALVLFAINSLIKKRVNATTRKSTDVESMMRHALSMGNYSVIIYDVKTQHFRNAHGSILPEEGITRDAFIQNIHPDDLNGILAETEKLKTGKNGIWEFDLRWRKTEDSPWLNIHGHAIAEQDDDGRTRYIVGTVKDTTQGFEQERKDRELAMRYVKMFDSTLVAMSFYDRNGRLIDLNQNMRKLCEFDTLGEQYFRETSLFDNAFFKNDFDPDSHEDFHVCQHMYYPDMGIDKYIEVRVLPTYDNGQLQYYIITSRDVTAEREMYDAMNKQDAELRRSNEMTTRYEQELHYLLENSNMWVWRSSLKDRRIYMSRSLKNYEFSQSFEEYLENIDERYLPQAMEHYGNMEGVEANINAVLLFKHTPVNPEPHWCASNGMPVYDSDGNVTGHFGIVRDITTLMEAQERLKRETARAEDSGKLKSVFLANMTHEIRTPLNAIVGFSDLLQMIDAPEERREFIRIIRNNCDMLIRLINDIIETSSMSQGPLAIESEDVDFAVAFNDICQTLAQRVQEPGVQFIVDNPYSSFFTRLDKGRMQQVITNFTTNAVKYTHEGHIKVGYRYISFSELKQTVNDPQLAQQMMPFSGIYMYCEDTGSGIPEEKQAAVFERFVKLNDYVQGTGLGLSICKSIAERCAGRIGVMSQGEGKGSTFWIWIPCEHRISPKD